MTSGNGLAARRAIAPVGLMALIFWSSSQSGAGDLPEWAHVVGHFTEYATLAALWVWALWPRFGARAWPAAAAISFLYAVSDEVHQSFVPGRFSDPWDVVVDSLGIAAALAALALYARSRGSTRAQSDPSA